MKQVGDCKLYRGDCLKVMKKIKKHSIDLIICDLPYGTTGANWDSIIPFDKLLKRYIRCLKDNGTFVLFGSEPFSSKLRVKFFDYYKFDLVWVKNITTGFMHAHNKPLKKHENIMIFSKGSCNHESLSGNMRMTYNPQGLKKLSTPIKRKEKTYTTLLHSNQHYGIGEQEQTNFPNDVLFFNKEPNKVCIHPTQKPVSLLEYLVKTYSNPNELVLDNTMGSGSTGIACINTNRKFIGIEKDKKYFKLAYKRIKEHNKPLFG